MNMSSHDEDIRQHVADSNGIFYITRSMTMHSDNPRVLEYGAKAIFNIVWQDEGRQQIARDMGAVPLLYQAHENGVEKAKTVLQRMGEFNDK